MRHMRSAGDLQTLADLCLVHGQRYGDSIALIDADVALSYADFAVRARRVSSALVDLGLRPGERVVLIGRNSVGWVSIAFGILLAGATVVPIGFANSAKERQHVIDLTEPRLVLVEDPDDRQPEARQLSFATVLRAAANAEPRADADLPQVRPEDVALIMSTSGSTGVPKQVPMAHGQLIRLYTDVAVRLGLASEDRSLGAVPLAHSFGFNGVLLSASLVGAAVRLVWHYDRTTLAELIVQERLTSIIGPPTILFDLIGSGRPDVAATCRRAISGGSDVPLEQMRSACARLGIPQMFVGYGLTETCGTVAIGDVTHAEPGTLPMLTPVKDVDIAIVDTDGRPVPAGVSGHIRCRGYNVVTGYIGDERATAAAIDGQGWLDTGDIGWFDMQGRLCIAARAKDTVIVSGFNVYPREVEHVLLEHESVAEAVVLGIVDERQGQRLVACLIPAAGRRIEPERLVDHCRDRLTAYKVPRTFVELEDFPTTPSGKRSRASLYVQVTETLASRQPQSPAVPRQHGR